MTTFVLVPGIACGSWAWRPVARLLAARGHQALFLTMPGLDPEEPAPRSSLQDAVDAVVERVHARTSQPVTLIAHSWGGIPVTGAAVRLGAERVREVVYYGAVVPEVGRSMAAENDALAAVIDQALRSGPTVPIDLASAPP